MQTVIRKWGNSPALRINAAAMEAAAFSLEQRVTLKVTKGRIVIEPADNLDLRLEDLVAGISRENLHAEVDFGGPLGAEAL